MVKSNVSKPRFNQALVSEQAKYLHKKKMINKSLLSKIKVNVNKLSKTGVKVKLQIHTKIMIN